MPIQCQCPFDSSPDDVCVSVYLLLAFNSFATGLSLVKVVAVVGAVEKVKLSEL